MCDCDECAKIPETAATPLNPMTPGVNGVIPVHFIGTCNPTCLACSDPAEYIRSLRASTPYPFAPEIERG